MARPLPAAPVAETDQQRHLRERAERRAGLRNAVGTLLASDGRPVFDLATGESLVQRRTRLNAEAEAEERSRLAAGAAEFAAQQSATQPPTPPNTDKE